MATVKVKFRKSTVEGKAGTIYYAICHRQQNSQISTGMHILPEQWANMTTDQNACMQDIRLTVSCDLKTIRNIISTFDRIGKPYSVSNIIRAYHHPAKSTTIASFTGGLIAELKESGSIGTAVNYKSALNSFSAFLKGKDISFRMMDENLIIDYEKWLSAKGIERNTSSFYMRNLRAVYNKAARRSLAPQTNPFLNVYTGIAKTRKRAINEDIIRRLNMLDLSSSPSLSFSRDIFIFSYCTIGMAFVDISYLRKENINQGFISYVRKKTGQSLSVRIEPCIENIIERYRNDTKGSPYIFPIITSLNDNDAYREYRAALNYHNKKLKILGSMLGENITLSSYTARHSWATNARNKNIPIATISAGMGHTSEKTTQIYLDSMENAVIDDANRKMLDIFKTPTLNKR
jgi:integrase